MDWVEWRCRLVRTNQHYSGSSLTLISRPATLCFFCITSPSFSRCRVCTSLFALIKFELDVIFTFYLRAEGDHTPLVQLWIQPRSVFVWERRLLCLWLLEAHSQWKNTCSDHLILLLQIHGEASEWSSEQTSAFTSSSHLLTVALEAAGFTADVHFHQLSVAVSIYR